MNHTLFRAAHALTHRYRGHKYGAEIGTVAAALQTKNGILYTGVSIHAPCGIGCCAEHSALAAMVTNREYLVAEMIAVTQDGTILPPCGRCREFLYQIDEKNLNTIVHVSDIVSVPLRELLPYPWQTQRKTE